MIADHSAARSNLRVLRDNGVVIGLHEFTGSPTEVALAETERVASVIRTRSLTSQRLDPHQPDSLVTLTVSMIQALRHADVAVGLDDVASAPDAVRWHALGATRAQGDFAGTPGDLDSVLPRSRQAHHRRGHDPHRPR
ncbi:hypothetical protein [Kibdelosporangium phytohabitans]|uniref:hypothetical protein n=1 Tax=Kibdelosporangium phytohabitans TaxID=860235 RepID=UPI0019DE5C61|nr:hypothetical protein [Kibdelosporangium phytohabitans]MBE1465700.1 putative signal transduction protein with EAL and GGDEF domain [Kibdelosporangium phytohabitans]